MWEGSTRLGFSYCKREKLHGRRQERIEPAKPAREHATAHVHYITAKFKHGRHILNIVESIYGEKA